MKKYMMMLAALSVALTGCYEDNKPKKTYPDDEKVSNAQLTFEVMKAAKSKKGIAATTNTPEELPAQATRGKAGIIGRGALLPNPEPMRAPITKGEKIKPKFGVEGSSEKGKGFIVPYFKAGNKEIYVRRNSQNVRTLNGANNPAIFIDGKIAATIMFWGSNKNGFGYPFAEIKDDPYQVSVDEKNGVYTYTKPYLDNDGKKHIYKMTLKNLDDGRVELAWDTGSEFTAAPWVALENYRGKMVSFGGKLWHENSKESFANKKSISTPVKGSLEVNGGSPVNSFKITFEDENVKGDLTEEYIFRDARDRFSAMLRTSPQWFGSPNTKGKLFFELGECAVAKNTPPPIVNMDFWEFDLTHVPQMPTRNLMQNSSFEQDFRYWRSILGNERYKPENPPAVEITNDSFGGKKAVKFNGGAIKSMPMVLKPEKKYVFSFYAKSVSEKENGYCCAAIQNASRGGKYPGSWGKWGDDNNKEARFTISKEWKRYSRTLEGDTAGECVILSGNRVIIDCIQLEELDSKQPTEYVTAPLDGNFETSAPNNDLALGEPLKAVFSVHGKAGTQGKVKLSIKNIFYENLFERTFDVKIGEDGFANIPLNVSEQKFGQGIFSVRADYEVEGFKPYTDYFRFNVMKKLSNTHATKNIFGTGIYVGHHFDIDFIGRKFMEWGFGSGSWYGPITGKDYLKRKADLQPTTDVMIKYKFANTMFCTHVQYAQNSVVPELDKFPYYQKWTEITPEMEKLIEEEAFIVVSNYPKELLMTVAFGNEEEGFFAGKYDLYAKAQHAQYRGAKRANPNVMVAPSNGTSGYSIHRGRDAIDGYLEAAKKRGFMYDAVCIHPYGNYDYDPIWDFDENLAYLIGRMKHYGYPDSTPIYCTECGNICDANIPPWRTFWYDDYNGGKLTYDFGNQEIFQACVYGRNYLAALKYWPKVDGVNVWTYEPFLDVTLTPNAVCKTVNTLGNLYPDVKFVDDIRPSAKIRGYAFKLKDGTGIAAIWTTDLDALYSKAPCPIIRVKFDQPVEFIDFNGNPRSANVDANGVATLPITYAPLSIKAKDVKKLAKALQEAEVEDTASDIQVEFAPAMNGDIRAKIRNATGRQQRGKFIVGKEEFPYAIGGKNSQTILLPKSSQGNECCKLYKWANIFKIVPQRGGEVQQMWKLDYFYIPKTNGEIDWDKIAAMPMNNRLAEANPQKAQLMPTDAKASYKLAWDKDNLYVRVEVTDDQLISQAEEWKDVKAKNNLYWFDGSLNICFDTANDGRRKKSYDTNDYVFHFAPPADGKDGKGSAWRWHEVDQQLAYGVSTPSKAEAAEKIDCQFKRTKTGYVYTITFGKRYIQPMKLHSGYCAGFGIFLHDYDKNKEGKTIYGGISNSTENGMHIDNSPQFWPLMILK